MTPGWFYKIIGSHYWK